ncbi:helix-turn-helix domain-containing protein [Streptomyces sp. NPDC057611]|uniref:helix-turn-helix domain-containing protein n=1 Tax=Streptomyces sp. NPDC057611 TaxID=3346182 RepID=UPI003698E7FD
MNRLEGDPVRSALDAVAPQLRRLRRRSALSLEEAARSAGLSPAHLSRLENGRRWPSLAMLICLARTYGTTVAQLLGELPVDRHAVVRATDLAPIAADGGTYWPAGAPGRGTRALRIHVDPRRRAGGPYSHPGEEWLYVLDGSLGLRLGAVRYTLAPGDSAHFDSSTPHRLAAAGHGGADLLYLHTLSRPGLAPGRACGPAHQAPNGAAPHE